MTFLPQSTYLQQVRRFSRNARLFLLSQAIAGIGSGIYSLLFNLYLVRLGYHEDFIGQVTGVTTLVTGIVAIPAGLLADRIGRRRSMLLGGIVVPLAYLAQTLAPRPEIMLVTGAFVGAGIAMVSIAFNPFMAENSEPAERPYLFSSSFSLMMLSGMVGNLAGGVLPRVFSSLFSLLPQDAAPYRLALWAAVGLYALAALPFYFLREDRRLEARVEAVHPQISMARSDVYRRMAAYVIVSILVGVAGGVILPFMNVYFHNQFGLPDAQVGVIFAASQLLMGVVMLWSPQLARRVGKMPSITAGYFSAVPFLGILALTGNPWVAAAAYLGRNVGMNVISPIGGAFAMELVPPRLRATLSGINNMAWNMTWAISSVIGGGLILAWGYSRVFALSAVFYVITGSVFLLAFKQYRKA
jgi:MFS family permease